MFLILFALHGDYIDVGEMVFGALIHLRGTALLNVYYTYSTTFGYYDINVITTPDKARIVVDAINTAIAAHRSVSCDELDGDWGRRVTTAPWTDTIS